MRAMGFCTASIETRTARAIRFRAASVFKPEDDRCPDRAVLPLMRPPESGDLLPVGLQLDRALIGRLERHLLADDLNVRARDSDESVRHGLNIPSTRPAPDVIRRPAAGSEQSSVCSAVW